jgi:hypothetical protein
MDAALAHIGSVKVTSKVPGALLSVDGAETHPLPLDKPLRLVEGPHKLVVSAPEHLDAAGDLKVEGGKPAPVEVALEPEPKPKPKPVELPPPPPPKPTRKEWVPNQRLVGLGAAAGGVLFGVAGLVTGLEAVHWHSLASSDATQHLKEYGKGCAMGDPRLCSYDITVTNREGATATTLHNTGIGLGIAGGVLIAGGVVFVVTAPKKDAPASLDATEPPPSSPPVSLSCGPAGGLGMLCHGTF